MNQAFPLAFSWATIGYFVLYAGTLLVHFIFMHYVLAGGLYISAGRLTRLLIGQTHPGVDAADDVTTDWLPFVLSAAITAAIAPVLFVQIIYQDSFYIANLLLNHRFMIILPVLIVAFYMLYVLKMRGVKLRSGPLRTIIAIFAALCFIFVAWTWTENHRLSIAPSQWAEFYESDRIIFTDGAIIARLCFWIGLAFPTYTLIVIAQIRGRLESDARIPAIIRRLSLVAMAGLVVCVLAGLWYVMSISSEEKEALTSALALPYLMVAAAALAVQFIAWGMRIMKPVSAVHPPSWMWWFFTFAMSIVMMLGLIVVREAIRINAFGVETIDANVANAGRFGGFFAFVACLLLAIAVCGWCVRQAMRAAEKPLTVS